MKDTVSLDGINRCIDSNEKWKCHDDVGGCGSELSFSESVVGSCCEKAAIRLPPTEKFEFVLIVNRIYERARKDEDIAEEKVKDAKKEVANAKKVLKFAEDKENEACKELEKKKIWRKKVQKRSVLLTKHAMKEENSDLESSDELVEVDGEKENKKLKCKVCFELFDDEHREAVLTTCGHKACFKCLSSLPQKTCPTCRADFTEDKILKIFD
ncbi:Oidioi.mRNA.OKI2018_I69.XSR.g16646.t1.cds [Oikopleura dioica]|uniref:Oidioi.mRNA.OKI2018_I69.XSR.g16646.t1.cds n=1 Tax=Oikopleura dioica TaxID=34765 RepID=A0ABN7SKR6_OIKDI|nr:Oidioi.mRNA.OKI2018_I69.XSR.g16646.t1.cds [Oikopleura dioica]